MPKTRKKCWSESFGVYGSTIRVAEREPGGILYLLWVDNSGKQQKRSLKHRDRKAGRKQAMELAAAMASTTGAAVPEPEPEPLTVAEGIARAFHPVEGMYPGRTRHAKQAQALAERVAALLDPRTTWPDLTPGKVTYLVRLLAQATKDGTGARSPNTLSSCSTPSLRGSGRKA